MNFKLQILFYFVRLRFFRQWYKSDFKKLQTIRWSKMQNTLKKSTYYQEYVTRNQELKEYPIMNKFIFMENFDSINTVGIKSEDAYAIALKSELSRDFSPMIDGVTIGLSSGTSGNRGLFLATETERAQWVACILDRVIGFSLKKRSVAFFLRANSNLYDSVKSKILQFEFFDLFQSLDYQIPKLNELQPTILVAQPSMLIELAKKKESGELNINPDKIISVAEVLYPEDALYLKKIFNQIIHQVYQCTEGLLATTCKYGTLHFNEDFLVIEKKSIDSDTKRFHPVITDLFRTSQPIVRYELNDIIHEKNDCPCGAIGIEQIEGRSDDILVFNSQDNTQIKIFPDFFRRAIIMSNKSINDYTIVQTSPKELMLYVDSDSNTYEQSKSAIVNLLNEKGIFHVIIQKSENRHHEKGTKLRRVRNEYRNTN
jgi:putative adenylate-forming enzyme